MATIGLLFGFPCPWEASLLRGAHFPRGTTRAEGDIYIYIYREREREREKEKERERDETSTTTTTHGASKTHRLRRVPRCRRRSVPNEGS